MTLRSDDYENNAEEMLLNDFILKRIDIVPFLAPLPKVLNDFFTECELCNPLQYSKVYSAEWLSSRVLPQI